MAIGFPWVPFLIYIFIISYTPCANNIIAMNNAKLLGYRSSMSFNYGILAGLFLVMLLCLFFAKGLLTIMPRIEFPLKMLETGYMVYLIVKTIVPDQKKKVMYNKTSFFIGFALQLINPKILIYGVTAMSVKVVPYFYGQYHILLLFAFSLAAMGFTAALCWSIFGSLMDKAFYKYKLILNAIMVVLLVYCVLAFFLPKLDYYHEEYIHIDLGRSSSVPTAPTEILETEIPEYDSPPSLDYYREQYTD